MTHPDADAYVLEIIKQTNLLRMSIFERSVHASTIRHYSELKISLPQINDLCREVIFILNKRYNGTSIGNDLLNRLKKIGQSLWDHLFTMQVKNRLISSSNKELLLSLDEELVSIPWELLHDGNEFLCLKFNLGRIVRTKEQPSSIRYRSEPGVLKMLILADPTNDLKSAYKEGVNIRNQFDHKRSLMKIDFKSSRIDSSYVKKNLRDYDIVHFAGHCEYDADNPKDIGWLLSDGKFTTKDILALSENLSLPNLIFSNACHSAKTADGLMDDNYQEKTYSLAAAFLFSGVRHYIGAIWKIEDSAGLLFAKEFYNGLIKGRTIGECIRLSRIKLRKEHGLENISWAGYILYGDPNYRLFKQAKPKRFFVKLKQEVLTGKRHILRFVPAVLLIILVLYSYMRFSLKNPASYFLFLESNKLFKEGRNRDVVSASLGLLKKDRLFLSAYPVLCRAYERLGQRDNCLKYYFEYAFYSQKKGDTKHLACAYTGIGWIYQLFGEYKKALDFYNKAISVSRENKDKLNEAVGLRRLAVWYIDKEDYNKALELLLKASEINRERQYIYGHRYNLACDYFDMGLVFCNKDDYTVAKEFYKKSKLLFEKMKLENELSDYYFNLGELSLFDKDYNTALDCYLKGLKIDETQNNLPSITSSYNMIGELYMEMGNLNEAEKFFQKSVKIAQEINLFPELAAGLYNLGSLHKQRRDNVGAEDFLKQAKEIYERIESTAYQTVKNELDELLKGK